MAATRSIEATARGVRAAGSVETMGSRGRMGGAARSGGERDQSASPGRWRATGGRRAGADDPVSHVTIARGPDHREFDRIGEAYGHLQREREWLEEVQYE